MIEYAESMSWEEFNAAIQDAGEWVAQYWPQVQICWAIEDMAEEALSGGS